MRTISEHATDLLEKLMHGGPDGELDYQASYYGIRDKLREIARHAVMAADKDWSSS